MTSTLSTRSQVLYDMTSLPYLLFDIKCVDPLDDAAIPCPGDTAKHSLESFAGGLRMDLDLATLVVLAACCVALCSRAFRSVMDAHGTTLQGSTAHRMGAGACNELPGEPEEEPYPEADPGDAAKTGARGIEEACRELVKYGAEVVISRMSLMKRHDEAARVREAADLTLTKIDERRHAYGIGESPTSTPLAEFALEQIEHEILRRDCAKKTIEEKLVYLAQRPRDERTAGVLPVELWCTVETALVDLPGYPLSAYTGAQLTVELLRRTLLAVGEPS